jgi:hypothetical protein
MRNLFVGVIYTLIWWNSAWCSGTDDSWRLSTDDTTMIIAVQKGIPVITQLGSSRTQSNWLAAPMSEKLLSSITQGGSAAVAKWKYVGGFYDEASGKLVLTFVNSVPALELQSIWRGRPGHGPVEHWLTVANHSDNAIVIGHQDSLRLNVSTALNESTSAWWIRRGGGDASTEGGTFTRSVGELDQTLTSDPFDGASPVPWLALQTGDSQGLYVGWEFSGLGRIHVYSPHDKPQHAGVAPAQVNIEIGNLPEFKTDLLAGETLLIPAAFVGCYLGDIDAGSYTLHRFVQERLLPRLPEDYVYPTLAYNLTPDIGGIQIEEKGVLRNATLAHDLGFETFVVDAVWFPQSGDWRWDPRRFPRGVQPIEEYIHSHGMKLGHWMAYTHGSDSDFDSPVTLNALKHPGWFTKPVKVAPEDTLNWETRFDLGYEPAKAWAEQATRHVVSDYKLDYFKTDYSPIETSCTQIDHRHHYGVDVSYWSTLGYYDVQEKLLKEFPNLMVEGCSGSGHIKDFGDIQHIHSLAMTDTLSSLPDRQAVYDSTFAFPPAALFAYTFENLYDRISDAPEPYLWRSAMMSGWQMAPTNIASWTPEQLGRVRRATEIYKSWIRPILHDAQVHHILPRPDGFHWDGMFYWSPTSKRGTLYIFRPNSDQTTQRVFLKGLSPNKRYNVRTEDKSTREGIYSGAELMGAGLDIKLRDRYTSDLIYLREMRDKK